VLVLSHWTRLVRRGTPRRKQDISTCLAQRRHVRWFERAVHLGDDSVLLYGGRVLCDCVVEAEIKEGRG